MGAMKRREQPAHSPTVGICSGDSKGALCCFGALVSLDVVVGDSDDADDDDDNTAVLDVKDDAFIM